MAEEVNKQVTDSITITNTKQLGEGPAIAANIVNQAMAQAIALQAQNAVTAQQHMNAVYQAATTAAIDRILHTQVGDAVAMQKILTGDDLAQRLMALLTALGSGQQSAKVAQSTPPETAQPQP